MKNRIHNNIPKGTVLTTELQLFKDWFCPGAFWSSFLIITSPTLKLWILGEVDKFQDTVSSMNRMCTVYKYDMVQILAPLTSSCRAAKLFHSLRGSGEQRQQSFGRSLCGAGRPLCRHPPEYHSHRVQDY